MKNVAQNNQLPQLDKANEVLKGLHKNITTSDRRTACDDLDLSEFTIVQYLKGRGKDLDTAFKLIEFFLGRIDQRERLLKNVA